MGKKGNELEAGTYSGNLGSRHSESHLVKAQLVFEIDSIMK